MSKRAKPASAPLTVPKTHAAVYQRAQIEHALWLACEDKVGVEPEALFRMRLHHLLMIDRAEAPSSGQNYAFSAEPPAGRGEHGVFSAYDAFMLFVGLRLQEAGLGREDIVQLARELRGPLRPSISRIMDERRTALQAKPESFGEWDATDPESQIFLLHPKFDDFENELEDRRGWIARRARLCIGFEDLVASMRVAPLWVVSFIEVGGAAYTLPSLLAKAPAKRRGRPPKNS